MATTLVPRVEGRRAFSEFFAQGKRIAPPDRALNCCFLSTLACNFDESLCGFEQDQYDKFDWKRVKKTSSGPSADHTGRGGWLTKPNTNGRIFSCLGYSARSM